MNNKNKIDKQISKEERCGNGWIEREEREGERRDTEIEAKGKIQRECDRKRKEQIKVDLV